MMAAVNADEQAVDTSLEDYRNQNNSCAFYLRGDRSMEAHINDVAWHSCRWAGEMGEIPTEIDLISFDVNANQLLRKRKAEKDYFIPHHEFLNESSTDYGEYSTAQADTGIESLKAKKRVNFSAKNLGLIPSSKSKDATLPSDAHAGFGNNVIDLDSYRKK
ncbi:MAG: hypothetical protein ACI9V8_000133 [Urechidicola sp.]|jgi:hypothetical protein